MRPLGRDTQAIIAELRMHRAILERFEKHVFQSKEPEPLVEPDQTIDKLTRSIKGLDDGQIYQKGDE